MKAFVFRFEPVLELRKKEEEDARNEMSHLISKLNKAKAQIELFKKNIFAYGEQKQSFYSSSDLLRNYTASVNNLREGIKRLSHEEEKLTTELIPYREKLKQIMLKRKALEILKEKDLNLYKKNYKKKQRKTMESIVAGKKLQMLF